MPSQQTDTHDANNARAAIGNLVADVRSGDVRSALSRVRADTFVTLLPESLSEATYTRAELVATDELYVVLIAWRPGQFSNPHDHGGSSCLLRVLRGIATESRFKLETDDLVSIVEEDRYLPGAIIACDGDDIHALGNEADHVELLVTLHVYRPRPAMHEYRLAAGGAR